MFSDAIEIAYMPDMDDPVLIQASKAGQCPRPLKGRVDYLIEKLDAKSLRAIIPDPFYRFDENRPSRRNRKRGLLKKNTPPGGYLHVVQKQTAGRDMVLFKAPEPNLRWLYFLYLSLGLKQNDHHSGSMYDNVLHTDTVISAVLQRGTPGPTKEKGLSTVNYKAPVPSIRRFCTKRENGNRCFQPLVPLPLFPPGNDPFRPAFRWDPCSPTWAVFQAGNPGTRQDVEGLSKQIQGIIEKNPELQTMINDLRKSKIRVPGRRKETGKVLHLRPPQTK